MQSVKKIEFIIFDEDATKSESDYEITPKKASSFKKAFDEIEQLLANLEITPEIAKIERSDIEMDIILDPELTDGFTFEHSIYILRKLEEMFRVTRLQMEFERDEWLDEDPHVLYGFYLS